MGNSRSPFLQDTCSSEGCEVNSSFTFTGIELFLARTIVGPSAGSPATVKFTEHWSLLASAGPKLVDDGRTGAVFYLSLKADY